MSNNDPVSEAVTMTESEEIDKLVEYSKDDSANLVGSDIRWLASIIRRLESALKAASCPTVSAVLAYDSGQQDQASKILELEATVKALLESQKALKADEGCCALSYDGKGCNTMSELAYANSKIEALTQEVQRLSFHLDTAREDLERARAGEPKPDSGYSAWTKTKELRGFAGEDGSKKSKGFWSWLSSSWLFHRHKWVATLVNLEVESGTTKMLSMCSHHCEGCGASKIKWVFPN